MNQLVKILTWLVIGAVAIGLAIFAFWAFLVVALAGAIVGAIYYIYYKFRFKRQKQGHYKQPMIYDVYEEERKNRDRM